MTVCNGSDCGPTPDITPPTVPIGLYAEAVSPSQINISWNPSTDPVVGGAITSGVAGYYIYREGGAIPIADTTGTSYSDTGLSTSTLYSYTMAAFDLAGNVSNQTSFVSTTTLASSSNAPNPSSGSPSGTLSAGTTQVSLSLLTDISATCRYSTVSGTSYDAMPNIISTTGGTSHSTVVTGLAGNNTYTYYIRCQVL